MRVAARLPVKDMIGMAVPSGGRTIVVVGFEDELRVITAAGGTLVEVAKVAGRAMVLVSDGSRVFLTNHSIPRNRTAFFELTGLG